MFFTKDDIVTQNRNIPLNVTRNAGTVSCSSLLISWNNSVEKYNLNRSLNNGRTRFKNFPGEASKDLLHYVDTTLQDNLFQVAVIRIAINDIVNNKNSLNTDHMLENI